MVEYSTPYKRLVPPPKNPDSRLNRYLTITPTELANVIASIHVALIILIVISLFGASIKETPPHSIVTVTLFLFVNLLIPIGYSSKKSWIYIPYLCFHALLNIAMVFSFLFTIAGLIYVQFYAGDFTDKSKLMLFTAWILVTELICTVAEIWCYVIVFKAWLKVKKDVKVEEILKAPLPKFTTIFTIFIIFITLIELVFERKEFLRISFDIIFILFECLVVFADKAEKPWAYLPFLMINGIFIILGSILVGLTVLSIIFILILALFGKVNFSEKFDIEIYSYLQFLKVETLGDALWYVVILAGLLLLITLYTLYHWSLVHRARKYMTQEVVSGNTRRYAEEHLNPIKIQGIGFIAFSIGILIALVLFMNDNIQIPTEAAPAMFFLTINVFPLFVYYWVLVYRARQYMMEEVIPKNIDGFSENLQEYV
ncbi:hypothetical protein FO519_007999 [Halicephalobus sp. NKZ332]|nr:hypothetical protein FO519_007999 [Halicephalobus sp. NKZ332]